MPKPLVIPTPPAVHTFDVAVDRAFEQMRGRVFADRLFYAASELGDFSLIWHLIGAASATVDEDRFVPAVRLSMLLGVESVLVNGVIKSLFRRERPDSETPRPHHLRAPRTSSFPSGHASAGFMAAGILSRSVPSAVALHAIATVVATSRIHVKIHHPSDVLAGALLGATMGQIARRLSP